MLSIILPTYNESANLEELLKRITEVMGKRAFEAIIVDDDSPDKTWEKAEAFTADYPMFRVIRRVGRRGLSSAVVEGFNKAKGDTLIVMDADLQHDPALLTQLADKIEGGATIAVASRYIEGGSVGDWVGGRRIASKIGTFLSQKLPNVEVTDPMSGFFAISADAYKKIELKLRPTGFKILLEILSHLPRGTKTAEVPLHFQMRKYGESKLSLKVALQLFWQLFRITLHRTQKWLFILLTIIIAIVLGYRAFYLAPLYADADVRTKVQATLEYFEEENGWLMSDMLLLGANEAGFRFTHRTHHRGSDEPYCNYYSFYTDTTESCDD